MEKRKRGRPAASNEPNADIHILLPVTVLEQLDRARGRIPRLVLIRQILEEWLESQADPPVQVTVYETEK